MYNFVVCFLVFIALAAAYEPCTVKGMSLPVPPGSVGSERCTALRTQHTLEAIAVAQVWLLADIKDQLFNNCKALANGRC
jgi:ABC-type arginine transport system permease subunit